jgi:tRNA(fMet)-specific endonuclease VapC
MTYLLDTDVFSAIARGRDAELLNRIGGLRLEDLAVSLITIGEIRFGLALNPVAVRLRERIELLLDSMRRIPLGWNVVPHYATLRARLQKKGTPIGPNDLWLAAHALAEDLTLVTANEREFARVPHLRVDNWLR